MAKIFEDFVCVAVQEALPPEAGRVHLQYPTYLDEDTRVRMRPDLVVISELRPIAALDAKYKAEKPAGFPQADLYQMLAYCTVLGLDTGHLVYARGNEHPATHRITRSGVTIVCHALDLEKAPAELLDDVATLATGLSRRPTALLS
jgi:5-methylcytosine-specific restriction enzyme subunit McrC